MKSIKEVIQQQSDLFPKQSTKQTYYRSYQTSSQPTKLKFDAILTHISQNQKTQFQNQPYQKMSASSERLSSYRKAQESVFTQKYLSHQIKIYKQILNKSFVNSCILLIPFLIIALFLFRFHTFLLLITLFSLFVLASKIIYTEIQFNRYYLLFLYGFMVIIVADFIKDFESLHTYNTIYFSCVVSLAILVLQHEKLRLNTIDLERSTCFSTKKLLRIVKQTVKYLMNQQIWMFTLIIIFVQFWISMLVDVMNHNLIKIRFILLLIQVQGILILTINIIDEIYTCLDMKQYSNIIEQLPLCIWILRLKSQKAQIKNLQLTSIKHIYIKLKSEKDFLDTKINKPLFNENTYWDIFQRYINTQLQSKQQSIMQNHKAIRQLKQKIDSYSEKKIYQDAAKIFNYEIDFYNIKYHTMIIIMHFKNISMIYDIIAKHRAYKNIGNQKSLIQNIDLKIRILQNLENAKKLKNIQLDNNQKYLEKFEIHSINVLELFDLTLAQKEIIQQYVFKQKQN